MLPWRILNCIHAYSHSVHTMPPCRLAMLVCSARVQCPYHTGQLTRVHPLRLLQLHNAAVRPSQRVHPWVELGGYRPCPALPHKVRSGHAMPTPTVQLVMYSSASAFPLQVCWLSDYAILQCNARRVASIPRCSLIVALQGLKI